MSEKLYVGVSSRHFYNEAFYEKVKSLKDSPLKVFDVNGCQVVGVECLPSRNMEKMVRESVKIFNKHAFGKLKEFRPTFFCFK